jgi:hypothetical protein
LSKTFSHLPKLALALCGLWVPRANTPQPVPNARESAASELAVNVVASPAESNAMRRASLLLELTETVTTEKVKPGDDVHFRVIEDVIEDGLVIIAKGTAVRAMVDRLEKHGGPQQAAVLLVRFETVKTVTGEELPIVSSTGNQSGDPEKLTMRFEDWPGVRGVFGRTIHYAPPGTRQVVEVALPSQLDRARFLPAEPAPEMPPGYATVYLLPPESSGPFDVWCGAVEIGVRKALLRPGHYSCRLERFSPQEPYLDFDAADGGTYYLVEDGGSLSRVRGNLSLETAAGTVDTWNRLINEISASGKGADLTKVDPAMFRKLPPFVCAEQGKCGPLLYRAPDMDALSVLLARAQQPMHNPGEAPAGGPIASSGVRTAGSNTLQKKPLVLELSNELTSRKAKTGDEVHFDVVEDVSEDGLVVIARGAAVKGKVERVDRRGGWMKDGGLMLRIGPVNTVTGEELSIAGTVGQEGGKKDVKGGLAVALDPALGGPITLPFLPFVKGDDYVLRSGTRHKVEVTMPAELDRPRFLAAQPNPRKLPGYATVFVLVDVWCGAVEIGAFGKTLLRPGTYSCRLETFSPQESYVDFTFSDGGTYYLVADCEDNCVGPDDVRPSVTTATGAVDIWNMWIRTHPSSNTEDLTEADVEAFRKLPPFLRVKQ